MASPQPSLPFRGPEQARFPLRAIRHGLLATLVVACFAGAAGAQSIVTEARAASVTGRVLISNGHSAPAFLLTRGYALNPGDRVDTRGGGQVVIDLSDGSMVLVQPESVVVLKDFRAAGSLRELFEITLGRVRVKINHFGGRPNPYRMNSPTASIAVRGTEFSVLVDESGNTQVEVYEGAVEVSSLTNPGSPVLIEAGRGVLVRPGQDFRMIVPQAGVREMGEPGGPDRDKRIAVNTAPQARNGPPPMPAGQKLGFPGSPNPPGTGDPADANARPRNDHTEYEVNSPRATAGTYERYIAALTEVGQTPFQLRFNAFSEAHLDSLENPAFATGFRQAEGRLFLLPSFSAAAYSPQNNGFLYGGSRPSTYSVSPQFSLFAPVPGSNFVLGGSIASSHLASDVQRSGFDTMSLFGGWASTPSTSTDSSVSNFWSASLVAARRFGEGGRHGFGLEIEQLLGYGSVTSLNQSGGVAELQSTAASQSHIAQTRMTAGYSYNFDGNHQLGIYYRYGFIKATDGDATRVFNGAQLPLESTRSAGHSAELGMRLRGPLSRRLFYGLDASLVGLSLDDGLVRQDAANSHQRDRARRAVAGAGLGYLLNRRVILTFDLSGGASSLRAARSEDASGLLLQNNRGDDHFLAAHGSLQADLTRRLFVSMSLLTVWLGKDYRFLLYPDSAGVVALRGDSFFPIPFNAYQPTGHYSDYGIGWRFSSNCLVEYVYSTDYGYTTGSHSLMLRYTFRGRE
jgi:hypothetical protein